MPIKPWRTLKARAHLLRPSPNKPLGQPTVRMAKALVAAASASGVILAAGAVLPRRFEIEGVDCAIENGCGGDMIGAGLVEPVEPRRDPAAEALRLTARGLHAVTALIGRDQLMDMGVVEP